jgi:uncharacterized protein (DUF1919 family)
MGEVEEALRIMEKYTIVSNSCVSMFTYREFYPDKHIAFIEYTSPFISSWFPDDEQYIKFCENYDYYTSLEPRLGDPLNLAWEKHNKNKKQPGSSSPHYSVMHLGDVEVHWIYNDLRNLDSKLLLTRYQKRLEISKSYEPIFLWCYHEMYNTDSESEKEKLIQRFNNIGRKTIFLTNIREQEQYNENTIVRFIPDWEGRRKGDYNQSMTGKLFKDEIISKF